MAVSPPSSGSAAQPAQVVEERDAPQPRQQGNQAAQTDSLDVIRRQISDTGDALKGARYALKPPKNAVQTRDFGTVRNPVSKDQVTRDWVNGKIEPMQRIAADPRVPNAQRAAANLVASAGEGLSAKYLISFINFREKSATGIRAFNDVRTALAQDPSAPATSIAYSLALVGIRNSGWRSQAEKMMRVQTTPELERVIPLLATHTNDLPAQTALGIALASLKEDGPLSPAIAKYQEGLEARVAALRARNPREAEEVDDQLREFLSND